MRRFFALALVLALLVPPPAAAQTPVPSVAILQNTVAANGNGNVMPVLNFQVVLVQITTPSGSPTFTVNFEGAANEQGPAATPSTFSAIECTSLAASATLATTATSAGSWRCTVTGLTHFQARISGYSGTGTVRVIGTSIGGSITSSRSSGRPGGSDTYVQFNDSGVLGGDAGFTYSKSTDTATLGGLSVVGSGAGRVSLKDASGNYVLILSGTGENSCSDAGANDTYACNITDGTNSLQAYVTGLRYRFKANTANTGAATINFNSLGAKTIKKVAGGITTDLADNDIRSGQWVDLVYDGTNMQMQSLLGNASGLSTIVLNSQASLTGVTCTAGEQTLFTYTVPASTLTTARTIRVVTTWLIAGTDANVTFRIKFGATSTGSFSTAGLGTFTLHGHLSASSTTAQAFAGWIHDISSGGVGAFGSTPAETLSGTVSLSLVFTCADTVGTITPKTWVIALDQ